MRVSSSASSSTDRARARAAGSQRACAVWLAGAVVLAGCGASMIVHPTDAHVRWADARWPGTTLEQLQDGRSLYVHKCAGCHALRRPTQVVGRGWPRKFDEMAGKAHLTRQEYALIGRYLEAAAGVAGAEPGPLEDPSEGLHGSLPNGREPSTGR